MSVKLSQALKNKDYTIKSFNKDELDDKVVKRLSDLGICKGAIVQLNRTKPSYLISTKGVDYTLGRGIVENIYVNELKLKGRHRYRHGWR